jgi:hypothetical protein
MKTNPALKELTESEAIESVRTEYATRLGITIDDTKGGTLPQVVDGLLAVLSLERNSAESAPQWRDKPTCAGLWYFPQHNSARIVLASETEWNINACSCFGPIPERPAT